MQMIIFLLSVLAISASAYAQEKTKNKSMLICKWMLHTSEAPLHQLNGQETVVYVSKDGHLEAVYDAKSRKLLKNEINEGTYNYFSRKQSPLKHTAYDIMPWLYFGPPKKTTLEQRANAYAVALEAGLMASSMSTQPCPSEKFDREEAGVVAFFERVLAKPELEKVYDVLEGAKPFNGVSIKVLSTALQDQISVERAFLDSLDWKGAERAAAARDAEYKSLKRSK